ncbi:uncharacterized protein K02A2.6-like [Haliotis rufescens]|uniref:uncharacterized protein K02A2.6-like n=1 Tax=Haliotis rufescens TaxID=6454 RepID=UPI00201EE661|nr:uncharacterized protein K02A2.6-like [Haliotis rufescens]
MVIEKCRNVGLKLNRDKCEIGVSELTFLGDRLTTDGLKADPNKVNAIMDLKKPTDKRELQQFMGMKNDMDVTYTQDKDMYTADALSRNFPKEGEITSATEAEVQMYVDIVMSNLQMSTDRLKQIRDEIKNDTEMTTLSNVILTGWPNERADCLQILNDYWNYRDELSIINGVIFKGNRVVVPIHLRQTMLQKIHTGHLGQEKGKQPAREVLFWPRMNHEIDIMIGLAVYMNWQPSGTVRMTHAEKPSSQFCQAVNEEKKLPLIHCLSTSQLRLESCY